MQPEFCRKLITLCHGKKLHCAIDTAGSIPLSACQPAVDAADLLLLDIKALDPDLCRELTGQDNKNSLALLDYCESVKKPVWIRHVLVPGFTLVQERLEELAEYLSGFSCVERIELLPFHKMGNINGRLWGYPPRWRKRRSRPSKKSPWQERFFKVAAFRFINLLS